MKFAELLTKHRNLFLLILLMGTLCASSIANRHRLEEAAETVSIPVISSGETEALSPLEAYRRARDQAYLSDKASLEALCAQDEIDRLLREDASEQLATLVAQHQSAIALEGALLSSELAPCVAVVTGHSVTIVTEKTELTDRDTALVLSLAKTHADASPGSVQIIPAE